MLAGNVCVCDVSAELCPQPRLWLSGWDLKCAESVVKGVFSSGSSQALGLINYRGVGEAV